MIRSNRKIADAPDNLIQALDSVNRSPLPMESAATDVNRILNKIWMRDKIIRKVLRVFKTVSAA